MLITNNFEKLASTSARDHVNGQEAKHKVKLWQSFGTHRNQQFRKATSGFWWLAFQPGLYSASQPQVRQPRASRSFCFCFDDLRLVFDQR